MTTPTSTPEPTGEADPKAAEEALYKLITACIIAGHTTDQEKAFEKDRAIERYKAVILKALRSSLPTAAPSPAVDAHWLMSECNRHLIDGRKEGAAVWSIGLQRIATKAAEAVAAPSPVPEGQEVERIARLARDFVAYERDYIRAQVMPEYECMRDVTSKNRDAAWRALSAAVDSEPVPAPPPGSQDLRERILLLGDFIDGAAAKVRGEDGPQLTEGNCENARHHLRMIASALSTAPAALSREEIDDMIHRLVGETILCTTIGGHKRTGLNEAVETIRQAILSLLVPAPSNTQERKSP